MLTRFRRAYSEHLAQHIDQVSINELGFIEDVNSFPTISVLNPSATTLYRGAGEQIRTLRFLVRGYVKTDEETSISASEMLARQIELYTATFPRAATAGIIVNAGLLLTEALEFLVTEQLIQIAIENRLDYVESARVLTVTTDEGLMHPYGICDLEVEMIYVTPY